MPTGTFETHEEDSPGPRSQSPAASTRAAKARPGRSQPGRPPLDPSAVARGAKRAEEEPKIEACRVPSKPTKKTRQGLAAKALQQAQEQLRHGQGAASQGAPRSTQAQWHGVQKATEKGPNRDARRVPNGTFETHQEDSPGPRSQSPAASTRAAKARPGRSQPGRPPLDPSAVARRAKRDRKRAENCGLQGA